MAHLAIVGSHSINGVAAVHSGLVQTDLVPDFFEMWPERFNNKTNGVTPRRWLLACNPGLSRLVTAVVGDGWPVDLNRLRGSGAARRRPVVPRQFSGRPPREQAAAGGPHQGSGRRERRLRLALRRPRQAHPRIQAAVAEVAPRCWRVSAAGGGRSAAATAAHVCLRRQGRPRLPRGQADHPRHQRSRPGRQPRPPRRATTCAWCSCRTTG